MKKEWQRGNKAPVSTMGRIEWWKILNSTGKQIGAVGATQTQCSSACPNTTCKCQGMNLIGNMKAREK